MSLNLLFEVPVYRTSVEKWAQLLEETRHTVAVAYMRQWPQASEQSLTRHVQGYLSAVGLDAPWLYSQVIAWVRVVWNGPGPVIKAYAHRIPHQRIPVNFKTDRYDYLGKIFESWFHDDDSSNQIYSTVRSQLSKTVGTSGIFRQRFIDLEAFDTVSQHLNWRTAIGLERTP
jgi:hypothetical protein